MAEPATLSSRAELSLASLNMAGAIKEKKIKRPHIQAQRTDPASDVVRHPIMLRHLVNAKEREIQVREHAKRRPPSPKR